MKIGHDSDFIKKERLRMAKRKMEANEWQLRIARRFFLGDVTLGNNGEWSIYYCKEHKFITAFARNMFNHFTEVHAY